MTLRYDLRINQGENFRLSIPVLDDNGDPVNVTGMTARGQIRSWDSATTALYEWSSTAGNITVVGTQVILDVPPTTSTIWSWRTGVYDVELVDTGTSITTRLVEGVVVVHPEITR